jgi:hypothetical protein
MAPVLRCRGEAEDANPARGGHLPVRVIRGEEPRLNPVRVAMGPASEMVRRALREHEQQQAVQEEEEDGRGGARRERGTIKSKIETKLGEEAGPGETESVIKTD